MSNTVISHRFQDLIETIEALPLDDQELLIEIVRSHLIQRRRADLEAEVAEAREAYKKGEVRRGTVDDLMKDLGFGGQCPPYNL